MTRPIILDLTPDAQGMAALMAALQVPDHVRPVLVLFSGAATRVDVAMAHARDLLRACGQADVPVYAGCPGTLVQADGVGHDLPPGNDGLGAAHLVRAIRACPPRSATVCCAGPLTTLALALVQAPDIGGHLDGIIFSGGAFHTRGNATPVAERNVATDPEAAATVMAAGIPLTIVPLGCTDRLKADAVWMEQLAPLGINPATQAARVHAELVAARNGGARGSGVDIGLAAAAPLLALLSPGIFQGHLAHVNVERQGAYTRGMTVAARGAGQENALVLESLSVDAARGILRDLLLLATK